MDIIKKRIKVIIKAFETLQIDTRLFIRVKKATFKLRQISTTSGFFLASQGGANHGGCTTYTAFDRDGICRAV